MREASIDRIRALLDYDKGTGVLRWRYAAGQGGRIAPGTAAGSINKEGYRYVWIDGVSFRASRLIWAWVTGEWPSVQVDHIDLDPGNDRWANLRLADSRQNKANSSVYRNNTSGFPGVYFDKERGHWRAKGMVNGKRRWLGRFATREEAYIAYCSQKEEVYGSFARIDAKTKVALPAYDRYAEMLAAQNGVCASCGEPPGRTSEGRVKPLLIDYVRGTKIKRGLLCVSCKWLIDWAKDEPALLERAADYFDKHAKKEAS